MKQLYYGKPTRRFEICRWMGTYLEKVKVTSNTATHPLLTITFPHLAFKEENDSPPSTEKTQIAIYPSLKNGKNIFDSSLDYGTVVIKAQILSEKLSHLWANVGCVIQLKTNKNTGHISIHRTHVPTLDQFFPIDTLSRTVEIGPETAHDFYTKMSKVTRTLSKSLTRAFNKIEREASELIQQFLEDLTHTTSIKDLVKHSEKDVYRRTVKDLFSGAAAALGGVGAVAIGRSNARGTKNKKK